ncbi:MAG: RidA family protein [Alphaproteobacteria bacterium]|nr:RidA family protein [Alphaproteobacteria bacterium]
MEGRVTLTIRRALAPEDYPFFDYRRFSFSLGIAAAGRIWLSGSTAVRHEPPAGMVVKGDLVAQAAVIYDKMKATLSAAQRELDDVVRMVRYVTPAVVKDLPALDRFESETFGRTLPVTTLVVHSLLRPEALIEIEAIAYNGGADGLDYLQSVVAPDRAAAWAKAAKELKARGLDCTHVVKASELATAVAFAGPALAGALAALRVGMPRLARAEEGVQIDITVAPSAAPPVVFVSAEGDPAKEGIVNQCRDLYARLTEKLAQAGASPGSVVKTTEFIVPAALRDYRGTADVRRDVFSTPYPAATGVICERLAASGALIAVEAAAMKGSG